jgi:hypothetical protein
MPPFWGPLVWTQWGLRDDSFETYFQLSCCMCGTQGCGGKKMPPSLWGLRGGPKPGRLQTQFYFLRVQKTRQLRLRQPWLAFGTRLAFCRCLTITSKSSRAPTATLRGQVGITKLGVEVAHRHPGNVVAVQEPAVITLPAQSSQPVLAHHALLTSLMPEWTKLPCRSERLLEGPTCPLWLGPAQSSSSPGDVRLIPSCPPCVLSPRPWEELEEKPRQPIIDSRSHFHTPGLDHQPFSR